MMKILIIEDEPALLDTLENSLRTAGYRCETARTFRDGERKLLCYEYDIVVLDLGLPDGDGFQLLKIAQRQRAETGVLIISARNALDDKITGLECGADDYLAKPFHLAELNARIKSVIRRRFFNGESKIHFQHLEFDPAGNTLSAQGKAVELTKKEHDLLLYFFSNSNRVLTKAAIAEHLWGDYMDLADNFDLVYTHVKNLRKKIRQLGGLSCIKTVYGLGYKFSIH